MTHFTVETVMAPVENDDWSALRELTDIVPGTVLIEDPEEPMLIFPVHAESMSTAAVFIQGVISVVRQEIKWGRAYRTELHYADAEDMEDRSSSDAPATVQGFAPDWLEDDATTQQARHLVDA